jgi:hypothetical protein
LRSASGWWGKNQSNAQGGKKDSNIFKRFLQKLARLVLPQITHLSCFTSSCPQISDKKAAILFLAITICCMLPRLPKFTHVIGFDVKNGSFKKAIFDVNKPHSAPKLGVTLCLSDG